VTAGSCRSASSDAEEAARRATVDENSTIALSVHVVKWYSRAVDNCAFEVCVRAVKAGSRAQRGRSNAQRLDGADANLTIGVDGLRHGFADSVTVLPCVRWHIDVDNNAVDIHVAEIANVSHGQRQRGVSDPLLAAGEIAPAVKSRGRSRHGSPY
jgi:hypothetical protein